MIRLCIAFLLSALSLTIANAAGSDFSNIKRFWTANAFVCKSTAGDFPSKEGTNRDPCDDGDMTLFNGLLCLAGESAGCDAVRNSQGADGRWWRSPRRINWEAPIYDVSFSPDQALGVFGYIIGTRDAAAFERWASGDWHEVL